jgi:hypothetical protein
MGIVKDRSLATLLLEQVDPDDLEPTVADDALGLGAVYWQTDDAIPVKVINSDDRQPSLSHSVEQLADSPVECDIVYVGIQACGDSHQTCDFDCGRWFVMEVFDCRHLVVYLGIEERNSHGGFSVRCRLWN